MIAQMCLNTRSVGSGPKEKPFSASFDPLDSDRVNGLEGGQAGTRHTQLNDRFT